MNNQESTLSPSNGSTGSLCGDKKTNQDKFIWTPAAPAASRELRLDGVRLLLVEDSPDNQKLFQRILSGAGANVELASNGLIGVEMVTSALTVPEAPICEAAGYDAIVMDIRMPILDGYEASKRIRSLGYAGPIIALTAHATPGEEERCRSSGCSNFYLKPIDRLGLLRAVGTALSASPVAGSSTAAASLV